MFWHFVRLSFLSFLSFSKALVTLATPFHMPSCDSF